MHKIGVGINTLCGAAVVALLIPQTRELIADRLYKYSLSSKFCESNNLHYPLLCFALKTYASIASIPSPKLQTNIRGVPFRSPIGISSTVNPQGFGLQGISRLGAGFIECGGISLMSNTEQLNPWKCDTSKQDIAYEYANGNAAFLSHKLTTYYLNEPSNMGVGVNISPSKEIINSAPYLISNEYGGVIDYMANMPTFYTINLLDTESKDIKAYYNQQNIDAFLKSIMDRVNYQVGISAIFDYEQKQKINSLQHKWALNSAIENISKFRQQNIPLMFVKIPRTADQPTIDSIIKVSV